MAGESNHSQTVRAAPPQTPVPMPQAANIPLGPGDNLLHLLSVQLPAAVRCFAPRLAGSLAEGIWVEPWPFGGYIVLGALAAGLLFPLAWPGMHIIYSESLLFLTIMIFAALLNGCVAAMLLAGYIAGDIMHIALRGVFSIPNSGMTFAGHIVGYAVLAIAAIVVPAMARSMAAQLTPKTTRNRQVRTWAKAGLYAASAGVLIYVWCQAAVVLLRPVFTWAGQSPTTDAIRHVQTQWPLLVLVGMAAAGAKPFLEDAAQQLPRFSLVTEWKRQLRASSFRRLSVPAPIRLVFTSLLVTFVLAGTYAGWIDALLVFIITAGLGAWRAELIGRLPATWTGLISRTPALLRFVVALVGGYLLSSVVLAGTFGRTNSLRPIMLGAILTLVVFYVLFPRSEKAAPGGKQDTFKWVSPSGVVLIGFLLTPAVALADNCGSLSDCWPTAAAAAGAAAGAGAAAAASTGRGSDSCESERNAVDEAQQQVDDAQALVDTCQQQFDTFSSSLAQQTFDTLIQGQQAETIEWAQNPFAYTNMLPIEQGLAATGIGNVPGTPGAPSSETVVNSLNDYFSQFGNIIQMAASGLYFLDPQTGLPISMPLSQTFIQSLLKLQADATIAGMFLQQLQDAKQKLDAAQRQLQGAQQALADCESTSAAV